MKKTVAVIFGGRSAEHEVSIITAHLPVIDSLQATGQYEVWPVYISKHGAWYADQAMNKLAYFRQPDYQERLARQKSVELSFTNGLELVWPGLKRRRVKVDIAFPTMHGTFGEDGSLMGLLRLANVPFVGCDLAASAIAMDKVLAKQVTEPAGIPSVPYVYFNTEDWVNRQQEISQQIVKKLSYPLFVKPVHLGSSIAISKVEKADELNNAIELALHYDDKVIVEQGVKNLIEVTLPIIGNQQPELGHVEQPLAGFFNFEAKYLKSGGKKGGGGVNAGYSNVPAKISDKLMKRVKELGKMTYKAIGAAGIARVDFLIDADTDTVYMNEINTLPGSLYAHNWQEKGVSGVELVTKLLGFAEERFARQEERTYTFDSEILKQVSGPKLSG